MSASLQARDMRLISTSRRMAARREEQRSW
jgi:hypothetical protein